jgi:hypothetical protein
MTTEAEAVQTTYNSSQQELEELRTAALETCQGIEEGEAQAGSSLASRLRALVGMSPSTCVVPSILASGSVGVLDQQPTKGST